MYCYYEVSDEFSNVVVNDHVKVKCCKSWSLGDNYFNKAFELVKVNFSGR